MRFKDLYSSFIAGTPIKREKWGGYWLYDPVLSDIKIFTKEGPVILFSETDDIIYTLAHTMEHDWEVATNENCYIEVKA